MNLAIIRKGFALIVLALITGTFVPLMPIPRLGLSAHLNGLLGGVVLIVVGIVWQHFDLTRLQRTVVEWGWTYANYTNWAGCVFGAVSGAGRWAPVASNGSVGSPFAEGVVAFALVTVSMTAMAAGVLSVWGMRSVHRAVATKTVPSEFSRSVTVPLSQVRGGWAIHDSMSAEQP